MADCGGRATRGRTRPGLPRVYVLVRTLSTCEAEGTVSTRGFKGRKREASIERQNPDLQQERVKHETKAENI